MDDRDIGCLDAAVGNIDTGRSFRCPADAEDDEIGFVKIKRQLPVIMIEREIQRVDALEILLAHGVLGTDAAAGGRAEIRLKHVDDRFKH